MTKVLVTGGVGFIGSHTAAKLLQSGYEVRILDNLQKPVHLKGKPAYLSSEAEFIEGDVRDRETLKKALLGVMSIISLLSLSRSTRSFCLHNRKIVPKNGVQYCSNYSLLISTQIIRGGNRMDKIQPDLKRYDNWLAEHFEELVVKYPRKIIAVVNDEIVAVGDNEKEVDRVTREKYPKADPFVFTVPSEEDLVCLLQG